MKTIETMLKKEVNQLNTLRKMVEKRIKNVPQGHVRIAKKKNRIEYYYKSGGEGDENKNGRYLKKSEEDFAKNIAQRDFDVCVLKCVTERIRIIEKFLENYKKTSLDDLFEKTNSYRKELIDASEISDKEYVKQWQSVQYEGKSFTDDTPVIITEKGERVRSKSEKIIADKLYILGIPYRYEYPVLLDGNIKVYPDFTILKMPEREEVYLEHFGMMDDEEYVNTAIYKLNTYERNGIYLGGKLFITYETSRNPLNTKVLDRKLRELFCAE